MDVHCEPFLIGGGSAFDLGDQGGGQVGDVISTKILRIEVHPHVIIVYVQALSDTLKTIVGDLNRIARLQRNWDSYGGLPVNRDCIIGALNVLAMVLVDGIPAPIIVPTSGGGVQLEWHRGGADLEIEVQSRQKFHVSFEDPSGKGFDHEVGTDLTLLAEAMQAISAA